MGRLCVRRQPSGIEIAGGKLSESGQCLVTVTKPSYCPGIETGPTTELLRFTVRLHGRSPQASIRFEPGRGCGLALPYDEQGKELAMATGTVKWYNETKGY